MKNGTGSAAFWKVGAKGRGLPRAEGLAVVEEKGEPPAGSRPVASWPDREWIGPANQGGGKAPAEESWKRSPKERQDGEMGDSKRRWLK